MCAVCATAKHISEVLHRLQKQRALLVLSVTENLDDSNDEAVDIDHSVNDLVDRGDKGQVLLMIMFQRWIS